MTFANLPSDNRAADAPACPADQGPPIQIPPAEPAQIPPAQPALFPPAPTPSGPPDQPARFAREHRRALRTSFGIAAALMLPMAAIAVGLSAQTLGNIRSGSGNSHVSMVSRTSGKPQDVTRSGANMSSTGNPSENLAPDPNFFAYCSSTQVDLSASCQSATLEAIDNARSHEGLAPMQLPSDWSRLTASEQLFVATNLERTARGLPAFSGMSTVLDSSAASGAAADNDATPPSGFPATFWTSNWAGGVGSPLESIYLWMYDDGPGSPNEECGGGQASGCWGHRDNILASFNCSPCVMGAAVNGSSYEGEPSWAELMAQVSGSPSIALSWSTVESSATSTVVGMTAIATRGYWLATANGTVRGFGGAPDYGSESLPAGESVVGIAAAPNGTGYWLVTSNGSVYTFGTAHFYGSAARLHLAAPVVGIAATPSGAGYWLVASDGGIFSYGNASFHGSTGNIRLNRPVVGMASTPNGGGYWLVAADGGVFCFGNASFHGSTGAMRLNKPVVGMTPTYNGDGYWLVAADGGIFSFGDAPFHGSTGHMNLVAPVVGMASPSGAGYWLVAADGGIFSFGVPFHGSMA